MGTVTLGASCCSETHVVTPSPSLVLGGVGLQAGLARNQNRVRGGPPRSRAATLPEKFTRVRVRTEDLLTVSTRGVDVDSELGWDLGRRPGVVTGRRSR